MQMHSSPFSAAQNIYFMQKLGKEPYIFCESPQGCQQDYFVQSSSTLGKYLKSTVIEIIVITRQKNKIYSKLILNPHAILLDVYQLGKTFASQFLVI